jgi:DNA-binding CsgD family transcriptional regulator/tetratricopeptide (TPR) repeat protein
MWDGDYASARRYADEALDVARTAGADGALAEALFTWAAVQDGWGDEALHRVEEGLRLVRGIGDADAIADGTIWLINALEGQLRVSEAVEAGRLAFDESRRLGAVHWSYFVAAMAAQSLLALGRFDEARDLLREALAIRCVGAPGALTRLVASQLAVRTGDREAARRHLDRALEVMDPGFGGLVGNGICSVAELRLAEGDPAAALAWIEERVDGRQDPQNADVAVLWAVRALADLAGTARDTDDSAAERRTVSQVAAWEALLAAGTSTGSTGSSAERPNLVLTRAEIARCRGDADEKERWERAVAVCGKAGFRWDEAGALARLIETNVRLRAPRAVLAPSVRRLHRLAADMGAGPLREQSEQLARISRVSLAEPPAIPEQPGASRKQLHNSLTEREREVLGHLVAGRTNGEIARDLVISDKTVSVHVSNILRKTGTSSRAEVASWAVRLT